MQINKSVTKLIDKSVGEMMYKFYLNMPTNYLALHTIYTPYKMTQLHFVLPTFNNLRNREITEQCAERSRAILALMRAY